MSWTNEEIRQKVPQDLHARLTLVRMHQAGWRPNGLTLAFSGSGLLPGFFVTKSGSRHQTVRESADGQAATITAGNEKVELSPLGQAVAVYIIRYRMKIAKYGRAVSRVKV